MKVFICNYELTDIASCIYEAWEWALKNGHENMCIKRAPLLQTSIFEEYTYTAPDIGKSAKVLKAIRQKIGNSAYFAFYYATLYRQDILDDIYRFLRIGFREGAAVMNMYAEPSVSSVLKAQKNVSNEIHKNKGFLRFDSMEDDILVAHIEPKNNILYTLSRHFADRMPSLYWIIVDDKRKIAAVHPADSDIHLRLLNEEEMTKLSKSEYIHDSYTESWRTFFQAVSIKERENRRLQRNLFPLWERKHVTEFRKS